jgi:hypothetical protein
MSTKLDVIQRSQKQTETGLTTFDLGVTSVINEIKEEGTKIKAMVDRHIEKRMQMEISQLSQTKTQSSLCSLHLNFTSGTTFSLL